MQVRSTIQSVFFGEKISYSFWICQTFVAVYILIPPVIGLQDFRFVPSYAICLDENLSTFRFILYFSVILGLFFVLLLAVVEIFSYRKVLQNIQEQLWSSAAGVIEQTTRRQSSQTTKQVSVCFRLCLYSVLGSSLGHHAILTRLFFGIRDCAIITWGEGGGLENQRGEGAWEKMTTRERGEGVGCKI